ncbi:phage tail sheath family protein [Chryseobacterium zhengzhouense]|uniref:Phage tail sheath family protein n=1 Tax=Chryseobacterium zhengzhouense TaxID=1636086 RepID=A0ABW2M2P6_9FLAO
MNYKTPGVYVEEKETFPPSVAQVETAIPAFIGYTAKGQKNKPTRISSMLEYEALFGEAKPEDFLIDVSGDSVTGYSVEANIAPSPFKMYYAMQMYFANGGGACYIVSVGEEDIYYSTVSSNELVEGLDTLKKEDEPTLIVFPDAEALGAGASSGLYKYALEQARDLKDRFVILDVIYQPNWKVEINEFLTGLNIGEYLKYGAAYFPKLETVLSYGYDEATIMVEGTALEDLKTSNSELYNKVKKAIESTPVVLAPSSAIAGVYAKVDSTSGVFKAPANVGLNYVVAPTVKISDREQDLLNVNAKSGKSINAIRSFVGRGPVVWGARTLDGNSNEWRYISVRRFFNMVEESVKKATERFVFEPNTANTWVRVQTMIENFLNQQWQDGALAGSKPEEAYYVSVGLNKTMSAQDILEGRMNIEIGMAAVRPAEFIVLRFSHKLQEA